MGECVAFSYSLRTGPGLVSLLYTLEIIGSLRITNISGNIDANVKYLFKTSHVALILNRFFTILFTFSVYVRNLPTP